jgi:hypothetical protein
MPHLRPTYFSAELFFAVFLPPEHLALRPYRQATALDPTATHLDLPDGLLCHIFHHLDFTCYPLPDGPAGYKLA